MGVDVGVFEPVLAAEVDGDGDDQGEASHGEAHVVGAGQVVDVVLAEGGGVHLADTGHLAHQAFELGDLVRGDGAVQELVRQGGDVGLVDEAGLAQELVRDGRRGGRSEHRADVDGHIEQREGGIALGGILRVIVEIAHQHLQIALEQARADGDERQGTDHQGDAEGVGRGRDGKAYVAGEHDGDTGHDALAVADLVGQPAAHDGHEIHRRKEDGVNLAGGGSVPAELRLEEEHEDGQHRVVAEALAGIGEGEGEETFGLSFEHMFKF